MKVRRGLRTGNKNSQEERWAEHRRKDGESWRQQRKGRDRKRGDTEKAESA